MSSDQWESKLLKTDRKHILKIWNERNVEEKGVNDQYIENKSLK